MRGLLSQTVDRGGKSFDYSTAHVFGLKDTIGSLVFPPAAQSEGWYYFGCLGLLLVAIFLFTKSRNEGTPPSYGKSGVKAFFLLWIVLITLVTHGKNSHLFRALWNYMPGFRSLRIWGRMNIVLVPVLGWLLAAAYRNFEEILRSPDRKRTLAVAACVFGLTFLVQLYLAAGGHFDEYWLRYFLQVKLDHTPRSFHFLLRHSHLVFPTFNACAFLLVLHFLRGSRAVHGRALFLCLAIFSAADLWAIGPWMWVGGGKIGRVPLPLNVRELDAAAFTRPRTDVYGSISLTSAFNVGVMENWYFERYLGFRSRYGSDGDRLNRLLGMTDGKRLYFTGTIGQTSVGEFLADATRYPLSVSGYEYTGDRLGMELDLPRDGYVSFIDNWHPDWTAAVDGKAAGLELLFGTFKSVKVPEGTHRVVFAYKPF